MKVTITLIELKSPLLFFALSTQALQIVKQLKKTNYKGFKKRGFWTKHYTMTLWNNETEMRQFAHSDSHLKAIKQSSEKLAKEIRTITIESDYLPDWKTAFGLLDNAKVIRF